MGIIETKIKEQHGFVTADDMPAVIAQNRLAPCLVRCGGGRFSCPAQDVSHFVAIIDKSEDYVRDVSLQAPR